MVNPVNAPIAADRGLSDEFVNLVAAFFKANAENTRAAWDALAEFVVENNQDIQEALRTLDR